MARAGSASRVREDALERAQDLIFEAWEARSATRQVALAKKALQISPLCADAYEMLARRAKGGSDEELDLRRKGVAAGEEALGKRTFTECEGLFWGILETRPYMRARLGLAMCLRSRGELEAAIEHLRDMLRLNPNDNQGVREILAAWLAETGRDDDLAALLMQYELDESAAWIWTKALAEFRRHGDSENARGLLAEAISNNRHVASYLTGERKPPKTMPAYYSPGEASEAAMFYLEFGTGWADTPGAISWLKTHRCAPTSS